MVLKRSTLPLALIAGLALSSPAVAAEAKSPEPIAHAAGGDAPPLSPAIIGVPVARTQQAVDNAADAVDAGNGPDAVGPLRASRRHLMRSYKGAKYLIALPPPVAEEASASPQKFRKLARQAIKASRRDAKSGRVRARASQDDAAGPIFMDAPTAVFSVLTSQYSAATASINMLPDAKGDLLNRVKTTLNTAIVLQNRLVKVIHAAAPPAAAEEAKVRAHASQEEGVPTFDVVMPGLVVLLDDAIQQMTATAADTSVPAESRAVLQNALAANNQIKTQVNTWWPPVTEG
jgi:hypothetical protein